MLSQLKQLSLETEGRYATDAELELLTCYMQSFEARLAAYKALQAAESAIVQETLTAIAKHHPEVFRSEESALAGKWKSDTMRVLRYTAIAMLMDDPETLQERFLLWFQTVMRAFGTQRSCDTTYRLLQDITARHLTPDTAALVAPLLELNRHVLSQASS